jgi:hypothetical protein
LKQQEQMQHARSPDAARLQQQPVWQAATARAEAW